VPLELTFALPGLQPPADADYINDCCWGGDVITARLLAALPRSHRDVDTGQEDWGWYLWITEGDLRLEFNVFCHSPAQASFQAHLIALRRRRILSNIIIDHPALDELAALAIPLLESWSGRPCAVLRLPAEGYR
jgi:hypothetical protein